MKSNFNNISEKIINTVQSSLNLLCECKREKDIQNILGTQLDCEIRKTLSSDIYPNIEIDVLGNKFAIEVKYNEKYYSGISQILIQKLLYKIENIFLLHLNSYLDEKFINAFKALATKLGFIGILINKREKKIEVINSNERM